jgi:uncharacterized protein (TIGR02594 family)
MLSPELKWIGVARGHIGLREIPGEKHEPKILQWWKAIRRGGIKSDEVPWCAAFVGGCLEEAGIVSSRFESAKSYLTWGREMSSPVYGCVVVFDRVGGGHVGFAVGEDAKGRLMVLGGNQGNAVSIAPFDRARVAGYRWPGSVPLPAGSMPLLASAQASSQNEA